MAIERTLSIIKPDAVAKNVIGQIISRFEGAGLKVAAAKLVQLSRAEAGGWQIVWSDEPPLKPGQKVSKKRVPAPLQVLGFTLDELREARLAPIVDFKGRGAKKVPEQG